MAARAEPIAPYRPDWRRGRVMSWITTVDHKRIGILYLATSLVFFTAGGILALLMRSQLATADESFITKNSYNELFTIHGTTMIFLFIVPFWAGLANFLVPADDRRARHGLPAAERRVVLVLPLRRHRHVHELPLERRRGEVRLVQLPARLREVLLARQRPGPLDPLSPSRRDLVAPRCDQLHLHDPQHARARNELDANSAVRLGDRGLLVPAGDRPAGDRRRADVPAPRSPGGNALLPTAGGWKRPPLPAPVLVLRPSRGLHHHPAGDGRDLRGHPRLLAQADLRLQGDRLLDDRDRLLLDARLGAPHVQCRAAQLSQRLLHALVDGDRRPDGREDLQLDRYHVARQPHLRHRDALGARIHRPVHDRRTVRDLPCRLPRGLAGDGHVLRRRAHALRPLQRCGLRGVRRPLLLVAEDLRTSAGRTAWARLSSGSCSSASTSRSSRSTCSG